MTPNYDQFASEWADAWNSHDLTRVMAHYADDIVFRSRKAFGHLGMGELRGKDQLRDYWQRALDAQPNLRFEVQHVLGGHRMVVIVYTNHRGVTAAETLHFDTCGLVEQASACHDNWEYANSVQYQVDMWLHPDSHTEFAAFEKAAFNAMARYGGTLVSETTGPSLPCDVRHIVEFPSEQAFDAYRKGEEAALLAPMRSNVIAKTIIVKKAIK